MIIASADKASEREIERERERESERESEREREKERERERESERENETARFGSFTLSDILCSTNCTKIHLDRLPRPCQGLLNLRNS